MFADPIEWFLGEKRGVVVLNWAHVVCDLLDVSALACADEALALKLHRALSCERLRDAAADLRQLTPAKGEPRCTNHPSSRRTATYIRRSHAGWPEIEQTLLEDGRGLVPAFPLDVFPPEWARWIGDSAELAGTPIDYVAQGVLAAVSAVCGAGVMAQVSTAWAEPLVLWQALVGWPSSGKSPALAAVRRLLGDIEHGLRDGDVERRNRHLARAEQARLIEDQWRERCAVAVKEGVTLPDRPLEASFDERRSRSQPLHLHKFPVSVVGTIQPDRLADALQGASRARAAAGLRSAGRRTLYSSPRDYLPPPAKRKRRAWKKR